MTPLTPARRLLKLVHPEGIPMVGSTLYNAISGTAVFQRNYEIVAREFGRLRMLLLWLHAFEEPFYSRYGLEQLPQGTAFQAGQTRFVSVLCCLELEKKI